MKNTSVRGPERERLKAHVAIGLERSRTEDLGSRQPLALARSEPRSRSNWSVSGRLAFLPEEAL
jgi:hypothetical protein